jgi:putative DNA primase/helicase
MKSNKPGAGFSEIPNETLESAAASSFEMEALDWLWDSRFALGKIGLIVGLPDEGKGQLLCYMAAQVTNAGAWPCEEGYAPQGNVLLLTAEDNINDTVAPRLTATGADLERVHVVKMVRGDTKDRMFNIATDLELLRQKIVEVGDVRLVLIDPISAYLGVGKVDSFRTTDVRAVLAPLVDLATELNVAIVAVMHFNKKVDITNAMLRISDSLAFAAVARHVYGVVDDAENERKLLVRAKNNVAAKSRNQTLAFRFDTREVGVDRRTSKPIWAPYIVFDDDYVDVSAMEAMQAAASNKSPSARDAAKKFLYDMLADGPILKSEIDEAAEANGISERTLRRAKDDLKVFAKKDKSKKDGPWTWQLPDELTVKPSKLN